MSVITVGIDFGAQSCKVAASVCCEHTGEIKDSIDIGGPGQEVFLFTSVVAYKDFNFNLFKYFIGKDIGDFLPGEYEKEKKFFGPSTSLLAVNKISKEFSLELSSKENKSKIFVSGTHILALLFRNILNTVSDYFSNVFINSFQAVVTFPIQFTDVQQEIVLNAASFAGFTSVGLLPKHLAAVAFYKALYPVLAEKKTAITQQHIFVLDMSWSIMTATVILNVSGDMVIQAMAYESNAGARDIDLALVDFVNQDIFSRYKQDISGMPYIQAILLKLCQGVKMTLLYFSETTLKFFVPEVNLAYELVISWELLQSIMIKLITKISALIQRALALSGMEEDNIAIVLFKGTNMPLHKAKIIPHFPKAIFHSISDQFSGAQAAVMSGFLKLENLPLRTGNKFWIAHASSTLDVLWNSWSKSQHLTLHHQNVQNQLTEFEQDINELKAALKNTSESSDRYLDLYNDLCATYLEKYKTTGNIYDLNEGIVAEAKVLKDVNVRTSAKPEYLANFVTCLEGLYSNSGDINILNMAILYQSYAINSLSSDNPNIANMYTNYGTLLRERGEHINDVQDIMDAAKNIQKAIGIFTKTKVVHDVPGLLVALKNLGNTYLNMYKLTGKLDDIHKMITCYETALDLTQDQDIQRASNLHGCANALLLHYDHLGDLEDLNKAFQYSTEAIKYTPDTHPSKSIYLSVFVSVLQALYDHSKDLNTLDKAIETQQKILTLSNHQSDQSTVRTKLGNLFNTKFSTSIKKNLKDLNMALQNYEFAVHLTKEHESLKRFVCLSNYGTALQTKFEVSSDIQDLDKGITVLEQAIECINDGPDKTKAYCNLADMHLKYYEHVKNEKHRSKAMELCRNVTSSESSAPLLIKFKASQTWITAAAWSNDGPMMQAAVTTMVDLLSQLAWPGQSLASQINVLKRARQCACDAAAIAINFKDIDSALAWLEQGRTLAWNQILQIRSPFDDLKKENPELAEKIISLSQELEVGYNKKQIKDLDPILLVEKSSNFARNALALERNKLLEQARTIPGFEGLMKTKEYSDFGVATYDGPVIVINVSRYRCDAVIITAYATPVNLPLEEFSLDQAKELQEKMVKALRSSRSLQRCADSNDEETSDAKSDNEESTRFRKRKASKREAIDAEFREILQELYIKVVEPILNVLGVGVEFQEDMPHIWWCPTGPLTSLPLHAAGIYAADNDSKTPRISVLDYVVSSYVPSLTALHNIFYRKMERPPFKMLSVIQSNTPGQSELPATLDELEIIQKHTTSIGFGNHLKVLQDKDATYQAVMDGMKDHSWVHLACHGEQDVHDPTNSGLYLHDQMLGLQDIIKTPLPNADFAFLSACQTATGDAEQPDEAIHLAAGMLLAGYNSVIASLWSIGDNDAAAVADNVYGFLFKEGKAPDSRMAARALHNAVRNLREKHTGRFGGTNFTAWLPYIHVGM